MEKAIEASKLNRVIIEKHRGLQDGFLELGELLSHMADGLFRHLGYEKFEDYLADPDVNIGRSSGYLYVQVYMFFVKEHDCKRELLLSVGISKLGTIQAYCNGDNIVDMLNMAATLSRSDLMAELAEMMANNSDRQVPLDESELNDDQGWGNESVRWVECSDCGHINYIGQEGVELHYE